MKARALGAAFAALLPWSSLLGFVLRTDESGIYVIKHHANAVTMQIKLPSTSNLSDGHSQRSSVAAAMTAWNAHLGTTQLSPVLSTPSPYSTTNGINEIVMDSAIDGESFPPGGALAVTVGYSRGNDAAETDIVFNTAYTWDSYRGSLRTPQDIHRVAIHELGHALGLDHPDEHGQYVTAIMNSRVSNVDSLQHDDIAGAQKLYGARNIGPPSNDHFSAATAINHGDGVHTVTGANLTATRESGEPAHATSTATHSVWWRWTAVYDGTMILSTAGSNYDTVLAAYTGTSVAGLTLLAENDDEQTIAQNDGPNRKRTSIVTFEAVSGTTYYFAVDGWGDEDGLPSGYTGSIVLVLNFAARATPSFSRHPANATVEAGQTAFFSVASDGRPSPALRWQRRSAGGAWTDLTETGVYSGTTTGQLAVKTTLAMDGEEFRCTATNNRGVATSNSAALKVTPIPLPVISMQPVSTTAGSGEAITLRVQATAATGFQWYRNGEPLAGKTQANLDFLDLQVADAGTYHVVVSNPGGSVTSDPVTLSVLALPTVANSSASRQVAAGGQTVSFAATATGSGTISLQWYFNGRPITGATGTSYSRTVTSSSDAGAYWLAATDSKGTRHGGPLFVVYAPARTQIVAWGDIANQSNKLPAGVTSAVAIDVGWDSAVALNRDGTVLQWGYTGHAGQLSSSLNDVVDVAVGRMGALALRADGTVKGTGDFATLPPGLKNVAAIDCSAQVAIALKTDGSVVTWPGRAAPANLGNIVGIAAADYRFFALKADGTVLAWDFGYDHTSKFDNVQAISGGINHSSILRPDGTVVSGFSAPAPSGLTGIVAIASGSYHDLALTNAGTLLSWGQNSYGQADVPAIGNVYAIAAGGHSSLALRDASTDRAPVITVPPTTATAIEESSVTFSVAASGGGTLLDYQWRKNGAPITGATASTLTLTDLQPADAGNYDVVVSNHTGPTLSAIAVLTVQPLPVLIRERSFRQMLRVGETFSANVAASGTGTLSYQWYHNGRPIIGATSASFARNISSSADFGAYWVVVTDVVGARHSAPWFALASRGSTQVVGWAANYSQPPNVPSTLTTAIALSAGWDSVIALKQDGGVEAWGDLAGKMPAAAHDVVAVASGRGRALFLKSDGTVVATPDLTGRIPANLRNVTAIACGASFGLALKTDGTVVGFEGISVPAEWRNVVAIAAGGYHALALKADGTVMTCSVSGNGAPPIPPGLNGIVAVAAGMDRSFALKADGTVVSWGEDTKPPVGLASVVAISAGSFHALALTADGRVVAWGAARGVPAGLGTVLDICAGGHFAMVIRENPATQAPLVHSPGSSGQWENGNVDFSVATANPVAATYQWRRNGVNIEGATNDTLRVSGVRPALAGLYSAVATSSGTSTSTAPAILGIFSNEKVLGDGAEVGADIVHPNSNVYDQILLQGAAATIRSDYGQVTRISFLDLSNDIVQVEFSGSGTLTLVLDSSSGPATPVNYHQPDVKYMKGHAGIVITGADQNTHVSVFSVGRINAVNQSLFRDEVEYDGVADIAYVAIFGWTGKFGSVRTANVAYTNAVGYAGLYAPGIEFTGPVYVGNITSAEAAVPLLTLGRASEVQINGGDLLQPSNRAIEVSGISQLRFVPGIDSHGRPLPAQSNRARLETQGMDVTHSIVVTP